MSRFSEKHVDIKRQLVNIYEVEHGLTDGLQVFKAEQMNDLREAVRYIKRKIDSLEKTIQEMILEEKSFLNGRGLKVYCAKMHIRKLEELEAELDTCKEMHETLLESMKKQRL